MTFLPGAIVGALFGLAIGMLSTWLVYHVELVTGVRKKWKQYVLPVAAAACVAATLGTAGAYTVARDRQHSSDLDSTWQAWEARMRQAGCKVTSFTSERSQTAPVYTCPDGSAQLGRWR